IARTGRSWFRARLWTWLRCWLRSCWFWFFSSRLFGWLWTRLWTRLCGRFWCFCCRFCWLGRSLRAGFSRCSRSLFAYSFSLCCFRLGCFWFGWLFRSRGLFSLRFAAGLVFSAGAAPANSARRRFTTGGSIVEDAEDTNSPISSSLVSASRDVIPSCLATSWTRSFATILLFWLNRGLHYLVHNRDSCRSNVCSVNDAHKAANRLAHAP